MEKSVKKNYALSLFDIVMGIAFPLITLPYVTRILSPDNIGHVHFFLNIISYINLISALGIPLYGVREIAKCRDDIKKRNRITLELLLLHLILTSFAYIVVFVLCIFVGRIKEDICLFAVLSLSLFFSTIGVSWFFQAIEDFKYITIRSLAIKVVSLILLFLLVKSRTDVLWYGMILVCGSVGNNVFNIIRLRKYISWEDCNRKLKPFKHVKPTSKVFALNLTIGIYTQLSVFLLGFLQSDADVGYYTMAQKIVAVLNSIVLALTTVLLPRLSNYIGNNLQEKFKVLGDKALSFVLAISLPVCVGLIILSRPIVMVLYGEQYEPSIMVLIIWAPILTIIGLSQIYGKSFLYSTGHEILMTSCTFIGMIVYVIVAIPGVIYYSIIGASIGSLFAELSVTGSILILGRKYHPCTILRKKNLSYVLASISMSIPVFLCTLFFESYLMQLVIGIPLGFVIYMATLRGVHDVFYGEVISIINRFFNRYK